MTSIGGSAFYWCTSLTSVTIGRSVTNIGDGAFFGCTNLTDIYYGGSESDWDKIRIDNIDNGPFLNTKIHHNSTGSEPTNPEIHDAVTSIDTTTGEIEVTAQTTAIPAGAALIAIASGADGELIDLAQMEDGKARLNGEDVKTVKILAWESLESMRPLCEAKEVEVTQ